MNSNPFREPPFSEKWRSPVCLRSLPSPPNFMGGALTSSGRDEAPVPAFLCNNRKAGRAVHSTRYYGASPVPDQAFPTFFL